MIDLEANTLPGSLSAAEVQQPGHAARVESRCAFRA
jgi:hypothetical protein